MTATGDEPLDRLSGLKRWSPRLNVAGLVHVARRGATETARPSTTVHILEQDTRRNATHETWSEQAHAWRPAEQPQQGAGWMGTESQLRFDRSGRQTARHRTTA